MAEIKIFKNDKFKLNAKQMRAIELLINCKMNQTEIANEVGVSERTLYNWMRCNEEFRNALEWYRKEVYKDYAPEAVETLLKLMRDGSSDKVMPAGVQSKTSFTAWAMAKSSTWPVPKVSTIMETG